MAFSLLACTDILGEKVNVELPFNAPPATVDELYRTLERVFRGEEHDMKESRGEKSTRSSEPFTVSRLQRYEEEAQMWVELSDARQLQVQDQLYVFRKNATKADISTHREIPLPRNSPHFYAGRVSSGGGGGGGCILGAKSTVNAKPISGTSSPPPSFDRMLRETYSLHPGVSWNRKSSNNVLMNTTPLPYAEYSSGGATNNVAIVPAKGSSQFDPSDVAAGRLTSDQMRVVFAVGDSSNRGYLTLRDFQCIFNVCQIHFTMDVVEDLHRSFAKEKRGGGGGEVEEVVMAFNDFQSFAREFAQTVSVAFSRLGTQEQQRVVEQEQHDNTAILDDLHVQRKTLEEQLEAVKSRIAKEQEKKAQLRNELDELRRVNDAWYREQEQKLLNKEVSVFRYRQKLHKEEIDYERLAAERRRMTTNITMSRMPSQIQQEGGYMYGARY